MSRQTHSGILSATLKHLRRRHALIEERIQELMSERVLVEEKLAEILEQQSTEQTVSRETQD